MYKLNARRVTMDNDLKRLDVIKLEIENLLKRQDIVNLYETGSIEKARECASKIKDVTFLDSSVMFVGKRIIYSYSSDCCIVSDFSGKVSVIGNTENLNNNDFIFVSYLTKFVFSMLSDDVIKRIKDNVKRLEYKGYSVKNDNFYCLKVIKGSFESTVYILDLLYAVMESLEYDKKYYELIINVADKNNVFSIKHFADEVMYGVNNITGIKDVCKIKNSL
jgi:hypothetical protein